MRVRFEMFSSFGKPWEALCQEVAEFCTTLGPGRLISISQSEDQNDAVINVWFWDEVVTPAQAAPAPAPDSSPRRTRSRKK